MFARRVLALTFLLSATGLCQTERCGPIELPISAIKPNGEMLNGLASTDLHAYDGRTRLAVSSLIPDYGPRRIAVVVDTARKRCSQARKAEQFMVSEILNAARPQDSVAFITARGTERTVGFGEDRTGFVESLDKSPAKSSDRRSVLDAVLKAIAIFGQPQRGDAIVVMAHDVDSSRATTRAVKKLLAAHEIRMFGLALGAVMTQNVALSGGENRFGASLLYAVAAYEGGDEDFYPLTRDSGGLLIGVVNPDVYRSYRLDDPAFESIVRKKAQIVMRLAESYYRIQVKLNSDDALRLDISNEIRKIEPDMLLLYPHQLPVCKK